MTRNRAAPPLYCFAAYLAVSAFITILLLLAALAGMRFTFALARFVFGPEMVYWIKPAIYDGCGFALASGGTALAQYYLASLLVLSGAGRRALAVMVFFAALFCGLFFWRGALFSALGAYGFSGLVVTVSALIGGLAAVFQKPAENPWPFTAAAIFR